jgi:hypothetical protein
MRQQRRPIGLVGTFAVPCDHAWADGMICTQRVDDHVHQPAKTCPNGREGKARHHEYRPSMAFIRDVLGQIGELVQYYERLVPG